MDEMKNSIEKEARDLRNAYQRKWRAENRDKVREANKRYWERRAEKLREEATHGER